VEFAYNYLKENYLSAKCSHPILQINQYPLPFSKVEKIVDECEKVLVLEDGYPFVEEQLRGFLNINSKIIGRFKRLLSRETVKLNPDIVAKSTRSRG